MRNILLTGNPATGKTFLARAAAYYLCVEHTTIEDVFSKNIHADLGAIESFIESERCEFIQIHPTMSYEEIVYGIDIKADETMVVSYAEKRIKKLCDRAIQSDELFAVIFDDISRINAGSLLGMLLYAMEFRGQSIDMIDGTSLCIPQNVLFIFTECIQLGAEKLDYAIRRRMDRVIELKPDKHIIEHYYNDSVNANAVRVILDIYDSIQGYIRDYCSAEIEPVTNKYLLGHGFFMVDKCGTSYWILDKFKQKLQYQIFPTLDYLFASKMIGGDLEAYKKSLIGMLNTGVAGLNNIAGIRKVMCNSGVPVTPYSLADTKRYYEDEIIPNRCSDYKGILESVIDAVVLNGVLPGDVATDSLLFNVEIASVPSKTVPSTYAAYLVKLRDAANYYYETARRNTTQRNPHAYYSSKPGKVGRWAGQSDVAAYEISYSNGSPSEKYLPLNGLRLHTFTVNNVCKENNPAEIYGAVYRLLQYYLKVYEMNISIVKGNDQEYIDLDNLILLEMKYLIELNKGVKDVTAPTAPEKEKARINYFGSKLIQFKTLWTRNGESVCVNERKFSELVSGQTPLTVNSYEDMYRLDNEASKNITVKGVVKMTDLKDYQQIMENIGVRQMVFQGPPGTSKTFECKKFVLKQLAPDATVWTQRTLSQEDISNALDTYKLNETDYADPQNSSKLQSGGWDLVQFHPSYGYEDFIRGIEVKANGGMPSYNSVNRILGRIAEFAKIAEQAYPNNVPKFYLVIDEINRANIATVFGELIYGLEYRDSRVSTPYEVDDRITGTAAKTRDIVLGKNLFIIGTMNTADKSIDSIDYAIRRRFLFVDSPADRNVVIECYKSVSGNDDENSIELLVFDAVQEIFDNERYFNDEYQKGDVKLGHTYFLRKRATGYEDDFVERFVFQIIPILREYVKDGILDTIEDLRTIEHTSLEIKDAANRSERVRFLSENIMLYIKEFGNFNKNNVRIDNEYIGGFIADVRVKLGF